MFNDKHSLFDWFQPCYTCETGTVKSRIDRCYSNAHLVDQLDRHVDCVVLRRSKVVSDHAPLSFCRRTTRKDNGALRPIQDWILKHSLFPKEVEIAFNKSKERMGGQNGRLGTHLMNSLCLNSVSGLLPERFEAKPLRHRRAPRRKNLVARCKSSGQWRKGTYTLSRTLIHDINT